jgi:hypothetical protein
VITEVIEYGKVLDVYPEHGCVQLYVLGLRTGIEYAGCVCQCKGRHPLVREEVVIERGDAREEYAYYFNTVTPSECQQYICLTEQ